MNTIKADYDHIVRIVCKTGDLFFSIFDSINSFKNGFYGFTYVNLIEVDTNTRSITFTCGTDGKPWGVVTGWRSNMDSVNIFDIPSRCYRDISELHVAYNSVKYYCCGELFSYLCTSKSGNEHTRIGTWRYMYSNQNSLNELVDGIYSAASGCEISGVYDGSDNDKLPITLGDKVVAAFLVGMEKAVTTRKNIDTTCD